MRRIKFQNNVSIVPECCAFLPRAISIVTCTLLLLLSFSGFAQNRINISGVVKDAAGRPLSGASVTLYTAKDTVLVKAAFTDNKGFYLFDGVKASTYLVSVSAIGYIKSFTKIIVSDTSTNLVAIITLVNEVKGLKEITVQATKPLFEQKADKMVVNVNASPSNAGANALEVLEKSPGITVDKDGNISLKGKAGVQIFIDGKPSYISGQDLANYLRNLQGTQLDQIEIMTNPSAKFDAAGNSGIINIKIKKTSQVGFNLSLNAGYTQGIYARNNQDINFNYRKNRINIFSTFSRNERNTERTFIIERKFRGAVDKEIKSLFNQVSVNKSWNGSNSFKVGADISISPKTTMGAVVGGFYNPENATNTGNIFIADPNNTPQGKTFSKSISRLSWQNLSSNFNFRHKIDSTGKELTAELDYLNYSADNTQNLSNYFYDASGAVNGRPDTLYGNLPQQISIYSAKADFVLPLKKGAKLEAGIKAAFVETDANAVYDSLINKILIRDVGRSNHFIYDERIAAAYVSYGRPITKKITGQFGLRVENTLAHGNQITTNEKFRLNYTQLFPTAYLSYAVNKKHNWSVNYGRRLRRPDYASLNPFATFLDRYTFTQGNPNLRPQFSHNMELSHTFKSFLTTTINYTKTNNIIQTVLEQNEQTNQTFGKEQNIANQRQYGISVSAFKQFKKVSGNIYVNLYNNEFKGLVNNTLVTMGATTAMFNASASYKFKNGIVAELNGFCRTAGVEGIFSIQALGGVNVGASMPMFKNKATLRLSARDIFWTQKVNGYSRFGTVDAAFNILPDSRTVGLTFGYRFTKGKLNNNKRKVGGAADEQSRVKGIDN